MNKTKITSFFIGSLKNRMLVSILAVSLISAGGIILSSQNNFLSNNSINNNAILAQRETTKENNVDTNKSNVKTIKLQNQTSTSSNIKVVTDNSSNNVQNITSNTKTLVNSSSGAQVSQTTNPEISTIKTNYLNELSSINKEANNLITGNADDTQYEISESSYEVYNLWNNELNKIYSSLKTTLTSEQMTKLQSEEINWIVYKEQIAKEDSKEYTGGSIYSSEVNLKLANLTKERCYYLVNNYM